MRDFFFKFRLLLKGVDIALSTTIVGSKQISIEPGCVIKPYVYLKAASYSRLIIENDVHIERYSHLSSKGQILKVGRYSYIGYNNWIGGQGDVIIGENFMSGMNVVILSSNHDYTKIVVPYIKGPELSDIVKIQRNVWIGANVVVLPGVEIGEGSVIAAGSVVNSSVPRNVVVAGQPARVVKEIRR